MDAVTGVVDDDKDEVENEESAVNKKVGNGSFFSFVHVWLTISLFFFKKKFDVNLKDDEGYTALHVACQEGAVEEVKILLEVCSTYRWSRLFSLLTVSFMSRKAPMLLKRAMTMEEHRYIPRVHKRTKRLPKKLWQC